ncbi:MAG: alanine--tRNA ligase [Firmicutes bacterium]|nr:alanine--tRNA ligase [Bacillota bacterium]
MNSCPSTDQIRKTFLDFFASKDHLILPSYSLIPENDPTLLLVGAGMAPLKPYFTGERRPPHPRIATCQKCLRTPDIGQVGYTGRHATFFEMLGNFSFGDYFKEQAIIWSWEFVTEILQLSRERLWISIYREDEESFEIWSREIGIAEERIVRLGDEDNFWEIGPGPCGPCSEIYYDLGPEKGCGKPGCTLGCDCDRYLEVWNLVFTQFCREADGSLTNLKKTGIDTGAGLERLAMAMQGVTSLYEIDLISPIFKHFAALADGKKKDCTIPLRVITEHSRGITFLVADGVLPSNEGRGYVLRRLLRRAERFGRLVGMTGNFLTEAIPLVVRLMGETYPELKQKEEYIRQVVEVEEKRFQETLTLGVEILEEYTARLKQEEKQVMPGEWAFKLYDTYGFPLELTREILAEEGMMVEEDSFKRSLTAQQERAREAARADSGIAHDLSYREVADLTTLFNGYRKLKLKSKALALLVNGRRYQEINKPGTEVELLFDCTPFYAEAGGQVGDSGEVTGKDGRVLIKDTFIAPSGQIVHRGTLEAGRITEGEQLTVLVDERRREAIRRSHTATHLLHRALKDILGKQVNQAGSLVSPDQLRFDFTYFNSLSAEEMGKLEKRINDKIRENIDINISYTTLKQAEAAGAEALFGEKYDPESVRMVSIGEYSRELCGGTHVDSTGEIGLLRFLSEEGIGSGLRRIEAVTGEKAYRFTVGQTRQLQNLSEILRTPPERLEEKVQEMLRVQRQVEVANRDLKMKLTSFQVEALLSKTKEVNGVKVISEIVEADSMEHLLMFTDQIKERLDGGVVVLGAVEGGKVLLTGAVTPDLVKQGISAKEIIVAVARQVGGGGGGRPDLARAGGKNPAALPAALKRVSSLVREQRH